MPDTIAQQALRNAIVDLNDAVATAETVHGRLRRDRARKAAELVAAGWSIRRTAELVGISHPALLAQIESHR